MKLAPELSHAGIRTDQHQLSHAQEQPGFDDPCAFWNAQDEWHRHLSRAGPLGGIWSALVHWTPAHADFQHAVAVNAACRPWQCDGRRIAGVSSFGMTGTNAHLVLAEAPRESR